MARHEQFIKLAILTAFKSKSKFRLGAILVRKNKVLSFGINNMRKTKPSLYYRKGGRRTDVVMGLHAEVHCTIGVQSEDLEGSTMYIARILKNGKPAMSKPCEECRRFLIEAGIKEVIYTVSDGLSDKYNLIKASASHR